MLVLVDSSLLVGYDLYHHNSIGFTYERDDGIVRSWIDHIIRSQSLCPSITNVHTSKSGTNLTDHLPLFFNLEVSFSAISDPLPPSYFKTTFIDWSKVSQSHIASYQDLLSKNLLDFPSECFEPDCSIHKSLIDNYSVHISSTLLCCASRSFPCFTPSSKRIVGWNDNARKYKNDSCFWYKVWEEAGCPVSGVLSSIKRSAKRRYKYEVRHLKRRQQYLLRNRLACNKKKDRFLSAVKKVNKPNASLSSIYS